MGCVSFNILSQTLPPFGRWEVTDSLIVIRGKPAAISLYNGDALAVSDSASEMYDMQTGKWKNIGRPCVVGAYPDQLIVLDSNLVFAVRGAKQPSEIFEIQQARWSKTDTMRLFRQWSTSTLMQDGNILTTGGRIESAPLANSYLRSCEIYNTFEGKWQLADSMITPRWLHSVTTLKDGKILVAGGENYQDYSLNKCEIYDPLTGHWRQTDSMKNKRSLHRALLLKSGDVLVFGSGSKIEIFHHATETWEELGKLRYPSGDKIAFQMTEEKILFCEGATPVSEIFDIFLRKVTYNDSTPIINSPYGLARKIRGQAVQLGDKSILSISGYIDLFPTLINTNQTTRFYPDSPVSDSRRIPEAGTNSLLIMSIFPNPTNSTSTISFSAQSRTIVRMEILNVLGEVCCSVAGREYAKGEHKISLSFDGLPSGVYFLRVATNGKHTVKKLLIQK